MLIGYLLLSISIFGAVVKGYLGKKISLKVSNPIDTVAINVVRIALCVFISGVLALFEGNFNNLLSVSNETLKISFLSGVSTSIFLITWLLSSKSESYMLINVFSNAGIIIPLLLSSIFYKEQVTLLQWLGVIILLLAVYFMISFNNTLKGKLTPVAALLLIICTITNGLNDYFSGKAFSYIKANDTKSVYSFYSYLFCFAFLLLVFIIYHLNSKKTLEKRQIIKIKPLLLPIIVLSVCLFLNTYFKTAAGEHLTSIQLYPVNIGFILILSTLTSAIFFNEKPNSKCVIGLIFNFIAIMIINL